MKTLLEVEIEEKFAKMGELDPSTKEYATAADSVTKLMDRVIKIEEDESAESYNEKKLKEEQKSQIIKAVIDAGMKAATLGVTVWLALTSLKFEENGSITTTIGRKTLDMIFKK
jgi:hypothetical protein